MVPDGGNVNVGTDGPSEVHLASVNTSYTGVRTGNGFIKTGTKTELVEGEWIDNWVWVETKTWWGRKREKGNKPMQLEDKWVTTDVYTEIKGFVWGLMLPE